MTRTRISVLAIALLCLVGTVGFIVSNFSFYRFPTAAMSPELSPGDLVISEGFTYLLHPPRRGDVIAFATDNIAGLDSNQIHSKRIVGLPNEKLLISRNRLSIDGRAVTFHNSHGPITYSNHPASSFLTSSSDEIKVSENTYFVLGDNTSNSFDSRFYGVIPQTSIRGKIAFIYWPPSHISFVH